MTDRIGFRTIRQLMCEREQPARAKPLLTRRERDVYNLLVKHGEHTRAWLCEQLSLSSSRVYQLLIVLISKGVVKQHKATGENCNPDTFSSAKGTP